MVKEFEKRNFAQLSQHFSSTDFDCKCSRIQCSSTLISDTLIDGLEVLWKISGALTINSGFRCSSHNLEVGGKANSQHPLGQAADIKSNLNLSGRKLAEDAECVSAFNMGGIGTGEDWVHVDVRGYKARWKY